MRIFSEAIKLNIKAMMQYKWSFAITLIIQPIILLINIALFKTIYTYSSVHEIKGYTLEQMVWYFTAINFVWVFVGNHTARMMSRKIISGELAMDMLKPVSIFRFGLAQAIASRMTAIILEFLPGIVIYSLIIFPRFISFYSMLRFFAVAIPAFALYYVINFLIGLSAFIIKNNNSLFVINTIVINFTGGAFLPLEFFPNWFNSFLEYLPFKYIIYWPIQFFLNKEITQSLEMFIRVLSIQIIWFLVLYVICKIAWRFAVRKFCSVGG